MLETIKGLHWSAANQSSIDGVATISGEELPYTFIEADNPALWERLLGGEFGTIAAYVPPPPKEPEYRPLSPRQFWLAALSLGITEAMVDGRIEFLDEPAREKAKIEKRHATSYERTHPLVQSLPAQFGVSAEALDAAWLAAALT